MNLSASDALARQLIALELALQSPAVRRSPQRVGDLIHSDFTEFGRSGTCYDRAQILSRMACEDTGAGSIESSGYAVRKLGADVALLTYRSVRRRPDGGIERETLRSSIWQLGPSGWQLVFHQGTPLGDR
ncbi:DUF4440 domain-containing protein [Caldimonas sp. KR1-144]|uniref:nuclear transport factor 2 family protein n=1 Tax=Caldimonas sp. KR1-144 TaxID=3400911 RepID=UPI003C0DF660